MISPFRQFLQRDRSVGLATRKIPTGNCGFKGGKTVVYEGKTICELQQVKFLSLQDSLRTFTDPQLVVNILGVIEHRVEADHQFFGDLLVL